MSIGTTLIPEFDHEMATTRRVLARVPSDKGAWKPHEKSFSMAHLAQLVARMPGWIDDSVRNARMDLSAYPGYSNETTETLLAEFDGHVKNARAALESATDASFAEMWSLARGDQVFMTVPRGAIVRMHLNHLIHHRGQLSVYLRLVDVPVPPIYGPTADERTM